MDILTKTYLNTTVRGHKKRMSDKMDEFQQWMSQIKLEEIQKALSCICDYDLTKFLGVIFGKEQKEIPIPVPDILKPYLGQRTEVSLNEAKAYLVSLYIFKTSMNAKKYGLIDPDYLLVESVYSLLKAKMQSIISFDDQDAINTPESIPDLMKVIAKQFLMRPTPYAVYLQREAKPIEIIDREDMLGIFISSMSSRWVTYFMFSQGFFGLSILCSIQFILNARQMSPLLMWTLGSFGLCTLFAAVALLFNSLSHACKDMADIDRIKSGYLKYLPQWLTPEAVQMADQQIIPQYLTARYGESKGEELNQMEKEKKLPFFLFDMRKKIHMANPLIDEESLLELLQEGLEKEHSWAALEAFLKKNTQSEVAQNIDRMIDGKKNLAQKVHELRRMIKRMATRISESQIRQLIVEGAKESQTKEQFQMIMVKRLQELKLTKNETLSDRIARVFMFLD